MLHGCPSFLTTGQAARLLSVTPDTVLKWIRRGRLAAARTAGGHHRIAPADLQRFIAASPPPQAPSHCWEYFGRNGEISPQCLFCPAYRFRAERCFEVRQSGLAMPSAFSGCPTSCEICHFYIRAAGASPRALVATSDAVLRASLSRLAGDALELYFASSPYEAASLIPTARPSLILLDTITFPPATRKILLQSLLSDPRLAGSRIALLAPPHARDSNPLPKGVAASLPRRLSLRRLLRFVSGRAPR